MTSHSPLQGLINQAHAGFKPPAPRPSTPQAALAAEGMTLRKDGTIVPHDGVTNHDAQYGRHPKKEGR